MPAVIQVWDLRLLAGLFAVAAIQYLAARLTWRETRVTWLVLGVFIGGITLPSA